jgi:hypothetical protein
VRVVVAVRFRAASLVLSGAGVGALLAAIVARYSAWPPLPIPLAALTAIIAAVAALLGVTVGRVLDLYARREERRAKLLHEVYFEAWDSLQRDMTLTLGLVSEPDPKALQTQLERFGKTTAYATKVYTTGSLETIQAFDELRRGVIRTLVSLAIYSLQQRVTRSFREELDRELEELVEAEKSAIEAERNDIQRRLKEKRKRRDDFLRTELKNLQEAIRQVLRAGAKHEERLPAAILAARRDLGFRGGDEVRVRKQLTESAQRTVELMKPLTEYLEKLSDLATLYLPKMQDQEPERDLPAEAAIVDEKD